MLMKLLLHIYVPYYEMTLTFTVHPLDFPKAISACNKMYNNILFKNYRILSHNGTGSLRRLKMPSHFDLFSVRGRRFNNFADIFSLNGYKVREIIAISAYTDINSVEQVFLLAKKNKYAGKRSKLRLFIDRAPIRNDSYDELLKINRRIVSEFADGSGIYLVSMGKLFHSKCYLIEGRDYGRFFIGSMNLTQNGLLDNEECLLNGDYKPGAGGSATRLADWIKDYADKISGAARIISQRANLNAGRSLREFLMNGWLYYEIKEQDPLRFKLHLPDKAKTIVSALPILDASITDSISVVKIAHAHNLLNQTGDSDILNNSGRSRWKEYCLETCYGRWAPSEYDDMINQQMDTIADKRKPYYQYLRERLNESPQDFETALLEQIKIISAHLKAGGFHDWRYHDLDLARQAWERSYNRIVKKLWHETWFNRIVNGIDYTSVPDVWNQPSVGQGFEESFCDTLFYTWSIGRSKNKLAGDLAQATGLKGWVDNSEELREQLSEWLAAGNGQAIFEA